MKSECQLALKKETATTTSVKQAIHSVLCKRVVDCAGREAENNFGTIQAKQQTVKYETQNRSLWR